MNVKITARHFKAHDTLKEHAQSSIESLTKFYDGILSAEVILSYEKVQNSVKIAEITLGVNGKLLKATAKSEDFIKSIDIAVEKIESQLKKYKDKKRDIKK
ncbi:MAG TPA: ribosome-associated translation inhibitor RaiA [Bacteroidota bacterium]|nr:ribosome-associated translation inhibitor RaiA [Bacteroidota bacterium]